MSLIITEDCINCHLCVPACPDNGIFFDEKDNIYKIDKEACSECIEYEKQAKCAARCPVDCMPIDKENPESDQILWEKAHRNKEKCSK